MFSELRSISSTIVKHKEVSTDQVANQIAIIFAGINGYLDNIALDKINQYETELTEYLSTNNQNTLDAIIKSGKLDEQNEK